MMEKRRRKEAAKKEQKEGDERRHVAVYRGRGRRSLSVHAE